MSKFANLYPGPVDADPRLAGLSTDSVAALFASSLLNQHPHTGSRGVPSFGSKVLQSESLNFSFNIVQPVGKALGLLYYYIFQVRSPPAIIQYVSSGITHVPEFSEAPLQVSAGSFGTSRAAHQAAMRHYSISLDMSSVTLFRGNDLDIEEHRRVLEYFCRAHAVKTEQEALRSLCADGASTSFIDLVVELNETAPKLYRSADRFKLLKSLVMSYTTELLLKSMADTTAKRIPTLAATIGQQDGIRFLHEVTYKWLSMITTSRKQRITNGPRLVEVLPSSLMNVMSTIRVPVETADISGLSPTADPANTGMKLLGVAASEVTDFNIRDPDNVPSQMSVFAHDHKRALVVYEQQTAQMPTTFSTTTNMLPLVMQFPVRNDDRNDEPEERYNVWGDAANRSPLWQAGGHLGRPDAADPEVYARANAAFRAAGPRITAAAVKYRTPLTVNELKLSWTPFQRGADMATLALLGMCAHEPRAAGGYDIPTTLAEFANSLNPTQNWLRHPRNLAAAGGPDVDRVFPVKYSVFNEYAKRRDDHCYHVIVRPQKHTITLVVLLKEAYTSYPSFTTLPHCVVIATTPVMSDDTTTLWQTRLEASFFMATFVPDCRTVVQNRMPAYISPRTNNNPCKQSYTVAYLLQPFRPAAENLIMPEYAPVLGLTELMDGTTERTPLELLRQINDVDSPSLNRPVLLEIGIPDRDIQQILSHVLVGGDEYTPDPTLYSGLGMDSSGRFCANEYFFGSSRVETATDTLVPFAFRPWMRQAYADATDEEATGVLSALPNHKLCVHDVSYGSSTFLSDYVLAVPYDIQSDEVDPSRYVQNTGFNRYLTSGFKGRGQPESFSGLKSNFIGASHAF